MPMFNRLFTGALAVAACSSCTIVDTGSAVDNVGRDIPVYQDLVGLHKLHDTTKLYTTADGKRYIKLGVYYRPARAKWFRCFMVGGCPVEPHERFYGTLHPMEQPQLYYAEIEGEGSYTISKLIPEAEFNPAGTTHSVIRIPAYKKQAMLSAHLPDRRNTLNTAVQPLRWVAEVADIPLSIIATPINWFILPTGYSLWEL